MLDQELDVRFYGRHEDGGFVTLITYSAKYFDGNIPIPGDTVMSGHGDDKLTFYRVLDRYFVAHHWFDRGWALLVERIDGSPDLAEMGRQWAEDTKFINDPDDIDFDEPATPLAPIETAEMLDYANRDPAYWTLERKHRLQKEREARLAEIKNREK